MSRRERERQIRNKRIKRARTLKRNMILTFMTICFVFIIGFTIDGFRSNAKDNQAVSYKYYTTITVENGDNLWAIANTYADQEHYESTEQYINEVVKMNHLQDEQIYSGDTLCIPYYSNEFKQ
ncbi:MAG: LysM peptidoglycan-binding domain-containing protein [Lachnospiraceae bacterium]|nr:LysM peptidoglycan-binding domain-containing protein [Lachnospiraceae bacterium]